MTTPGHDLGALRRRISHTCPVCGQEFTGLVTARTCSNKCRQALKYRRLKAKMFENPQK
jgi:predicted nucleic acid-binding Zn ribbon protein